MKLPGQPWSKMIGIAFAFFEKIATKWMSRVMLSMSWIGTLKFGKEFMCFSLILLGHC